jgi:chromatin segregation and condensation protein Rec8/ScpA/Scc1 (kleisin family)
VARPLDVESATARIESLLERQAEFSWQDIVGDRPGVVEVLSAFIALLELARRGSLTLHQPQPFSPLRIRREPPREAA